MHNTQLLDWDSHILGLSVAKILTTPLTTQELETLLQTLKAQGVKLVYWLIDSTDALSQQAAQDCAGFLADEKLSYCLDLMTLAPLPPDKGVEVYSEYTANAELEAIAIEISQFSRFAHDPKLSAEQVSKLYKAWINNACRKIVAKAVLVIKEQSSIAGMVVIDEKQARGDLSLVGVTPAYQGQGLGKRLVHAAQHWCLEHGYFISQVVTQKTNPKACRLYESCGYQLEKMEYFYHFWL
ncbi:GNAT family N-acetyltransferase [Rickettsiella endosymbiont of Dermanyssus gallinae]|uniref:GNAT family N-acetyltransferase n=1 Tax=Rickettsiella endosymbiont of Dermanyssus gallinae TaxID=2856608 RepID=UPI001C5310ED|nr:GNAT family N-acetyltransferase [Rickettsiella endosymbiont of Dermanyssus gallinae]